MNDKVEWLLLRNLKWRVASPKTSDHDYMKVFNTLPVCVSSSSYNRGEEGQETISSEFYLNQSNLTIFHFILQRQKNRWEGGGGRIRGKWYFILEYIIIYGFLCN